MRPEHSGNGPDPGQRVGHHGKGSATRIWQTPKKNKELNKSVPICSLCGNKCSYEMIILEIRINPGQLCDWNRNHNILATEGWLESEPNPGRGMLASGKAFVVGSRAGSFTSPKEQRNQSPFVGESWGNQNCHSKGRKTSIQPSCCC